MSGSKAQCSPGPPPHRLSCSSLLPFQPRGIAATSWPAPPFSNPAPKPGLDPKQASGPAAAPGVSGGDVNTPSRPEQARGRPGRAAMQERPTQSCSHTTQNTPFQKGWWAPAWNAPTRGLGPRQPPPSSGIRRTMTWLPQSWGCGPSSGRGEGQAELKPQMWGIRAAFLPARLGPQRPARLPKASTAPCCSLRAALQPPPQGLGAERSRAGPWGWVSSFPQRPPNASRLPTTSCGATSSPPPLTHTVSNAATPDRRAPPSGVVLLGRGGTPSPPPGVRQKPQGLDESGEGTFSSWPLAGVPEGTGRTHGGGGGDVIAAGPAGPGQAHRSVQGAHGTGCCQEPGKGRRWWGGWLQAQGLVHLPVGPQAVPLGDGPPGMGQHVHPVLQGLAGGPGSQSHLTHGLGPKPRAPGPDGQHQVHTLWAEIGRGAVEGRKTAVSLAPREDLPPPPGSLPGSG